MSCPVCNGLPGCPVCGDWDDDEDNEPDWDTIRDERMEDDEYDAKNNR